MTWVGEWKVEFSASLLLDTLLRFVRGEFIYPETLDGLAKSNHALVFSFVD